MTDYTLSPGELKTLALFQSDHEPMDIHPHHFAKLLSLALIEQKDGGSVPTESGIERLQQVREVQ